jgi:uncharacterized protein YwgA
MTNQSNAVARIVSLNGGKLVGKTRLQKSAYLLESCGVGFGFDFTYHYYGPYSEELSLWADVSEALDSVKVEHARTEYGASYPIYKTQKGQVDVNECDTTRSNILKVLSRYGTIELELAATAVFLANNGYRDNPWDETIIRKATKATPERVRKAKALLEEIQEFRH